MTKKVKTLTDEEINGPIKIENHRPVSRRDFLAKGFLAGTAWALAPNMLELISKRSFFSQVFGADISDCGGVPALNQNIPVIIFDLAGGANIAGSNVIVGSAGAQENFLPEADYASLGLPPDMTPDKAGQINSELGLKFHSDSGFLRGILAQTTVQMRSRVEGGIFCASSADDTGNNPHNPMYWLAKAGAGGDLAKIAGTSSSQSGGRSAAPKSSVNPNIQPVALNDTRDAINLVTAGRLSSLLSEDKVQSVLRAVERMSERQLKRYDQLALSDQIKTLVECGYLQTRDLVGRYSSAEIDPSQDALVNQAFDDLGNGDQKKTATIAKLVLDGHIGAGTITKGGYDYHNGTRQTGEVRDFEAGELIGRIIKLASLKNKSVLIYVFTDGGISARNTIDTSANGRGKYIWGGDSSQRSSAMVLTFNPSARAKLRNGTRQIGGFKKGGSVDLFAATTANSVVNLNKAFVANYLAIHGNESMLAEVVGDNPFAGALDDYLFFEKFF